MVAPAVIAAQGFGQDDRGHQRWPFAPVPEFGQASTVTVSRVTPWESRMSVTRYDDGARAQQGWRLTAANWCGDSARPRDMRGRRGLWSRPGPILSEAVVVGSWAACQYRCHLWRSHRHKDGYSDL